MREIGKKLLNALISLVHVVAIEFQCSLLQEVAKSNLTRFFKTSST